MHVCSLTHSLTHSSTEFLTGNTRQSEQITYFCFTCTPTASSLKQFGMMQDHTYVPFASYSLHQAIADGLVLDVLMNYRTVCPLASIEQVCVCVFFFPYCVLSVCLACARKMIFVLPFPLSFAIVCGVLFTCQHAYTCASSMWLTSPSKLNRKTR
jgi:hypothetical protein